MLDKKINLSKFLKVTSLTVLLLSGGIFLCFQNILAATSTGATLNPSSAPPETSSSNGPNQQLIDDLNRQINEQQAQIDQIVGQINGYKTGLQQAQGQSITLQNQVKLLNNQIAQAELNIASKNAEIKRTNLQIQQVQLEMKNNQDIIERDKTQIGDYINILDRYDHKSYLDVVLSNKSFSEFFDQIKYLESIQGDLQTTLNQVQETAIKLASQKKDLDDKKKQLSDLLNKLEDAKLVFENQKGEKTYLVAESKDSERKFQSVITDLKKVQQSASASIASLERQVRAELNKNSSTNKLSSMGNAVLSWPTSGRTITAIFHDPTYPYRNIIGEHSGIDLGIGMGTPVKAAEAGYVAKVALGTKWYGNYIMIIHNNNLSTLYAHLSSTSVEGDQYVAKGQVIGYSGSTGFSSGPHLHFEVRYNGVPVDPQNYLP
ncbi:MAG: peptidoglycan DD-metalloendopeptidase family protein [bacterium]